MSMEYVAQPGQIEGTLPVRQGGTGNPRGWALGEILAIQNRTGGTIAQYSVVTIDPGTQGLIVCSQDSQVPVLGVVVGTLDNTGVLTEGGCADQAIACVVTAGVVPMIFDAITGLVGEYVYTSGTNQGHVYGKNTRGAGAIGMLLSSTGLFSAPTTYMVAMWSGVSLAGPLHTQQEGASVNLESDSLDFGAVLPAHTSGHTTAVDIAPELLGGLKAAQIAYSYGAAGTTLLRPNSDKATITPITYSSGSTGWNLVNGTGHSGASYWQGTGIASPSASIVHGFPDPGLDFTHRIDSIELHVYREEGLAGANGRLIARDPATSAYYYQGSYVPGNGEIAYTYTTRPWDGRPWTIGDLPYLQFGVTQNGKTEQVWIVINWTLIDSVATEITNIEAADALAATYVWRPLLGGDGSIITAGPGGEAVMGYDRL